LVRVECSFLGKLPCALDAFLCVGDAALRVTFDGFPVRDRLVVLEGINECGVGPKRTQELHEVGFQQIGPVARMRF
jgi:hypothetical protein